MKESRFPSMGLEDGFRVGIFESIDEGDKQAGRPGAMLDAANDSAVTWGAGSVARKMYVQQLERVTGVVRKFVEKASKKDPTKKTKSYSSTDGGESENSYVKRIKALLMKGDEAVATSFYSHFKLNSQKDGAGNEEETVDPVLQTIADGLSVYGYDEKGVAKPNPATGKVEHVFNVDLKEAERSKKVEALAQRYKDAAANIIKNGSQEKWITTFKKENIQHADFVGGDEATNALNLAYAVKAREQAKEKAAAEKRAAEYQ